MDSYYLLKRRKVPVVNLTNHLDDRKATRKQGNRLHTPQIKQAIMDTLQPHVR
jgi:hypothetical protein